MPYAHVNMMLCCWLVALCPARLIARQRWIWAFGRICQLVRRRKRKQFEIMSQRATDRYATACRCLMRGNMSVPNRCRRLSLTFGRAGYNGAAVVIVYSSSSGQCGVDERGPPIAEGTALQ